MLVEWKQATSWLAEAPAHALQRALLDLDRAYTNFFRKGLNRSILDASPFELRRQLEYKTPWKGGLLVPVSAPNTSRKCLECGHTSAENRQTQTKFVCVECGFSAHADWVAAINIKEAGLASVACSSACSSSSHAADASCQEPTEGLVCASV